MVRRGVRGPAVVAAAGVLLLGLPSAASAKIVERERYSFSDSFTDDICGLEVEVGVEASGMFMIRADKRDSPAFFSSDVFEFREVVTNPETGRWAVARGRGNFREVTATHVEGDIYGFRAQTAVQHFVIENSDGEVVYRDRGLLVFEAVWDTFGDDEPGGELLNFELVSIRGHPGFIDDLCPLVHDLLG